ncbi:digestive organ expansion factor [Vararia minispora EC-137]|uniref:Digestive organ expansion factor n=1 Tax=Vararia minispora EC-137 TaxID=1314806 RepID=A0ACB8QM30_9AGAM|nr:digestive organ expansion factor [Vararia minispora EC-137]
MPGLIDDPNSPKTKLLTLLNVSAFKSSKRKRLYDDGEEPVISRKLNKKKSISFVEEVQTREFSSAPEEGPELGEEDAALAEAEDAVDSADEATSDIEDTGDPYERHFGVAASYITEPARQAVENRSFTTSSTSYGKLGSIAESVPTSLFPITRSKDPHSTVLQRLRSPLVERQARLPQGRRELQNDCLSVLSTYRDFYHTHTSFETSPHLRDTISLHALNHVLKKRRRILKNNGRISNSTKTNNSPPEDVQDQGFTRPSVLVLLPFRSSALKWMESLTSHTPSPIWQVENRARFVKEFGLPEGTVDKLATAEFGTYPQDHVETFQGNVDDSFRVGIKVTKKSVKLFADFYSADIIIASPLGLRLSVQKEKLNWDFLSSIEMLIIDQMDILAMQNWEHVQAILLQFILSHLNELPKESHNTDFSRIKPWYLDGHATFLRQNVLLSAFETPETRNLYNRTLKNVVGKARTVRHWAPVQVPDGLDQNFMWFDCTGIKDEPDKRFVFFTTQVLPTILKSAVQSSQTAIIIPSSLDFIRVQNHFRKQELSYAVLSEYSKGPDISRARQAFFTGRKSFLLISERFHFYHRYKIRGIRNLVFYGPPDHASFYTEFLSLPFVEPDVDVSDVTCRVIYSKFDWFRLERIAGTKEAGALLKAAGA